MDKNSSRKTGARKFMRTRVDFIVLDPDVYLHPKAAKDRPMHEPRRHNRQHAKQVARMMVKAANETSRSGTLVVSVRGSCGCEPRVKVRAAEGAS